MGAVAYGVNVHGETCSIELLHQARETLRIEIKLAGMLGRFAVFVEIGREQRRRLRRVFHHSVGEDFDHPGVKEVRIDVAILADLHKTRDGLVAVVTRIGNVDRCANAHGEPAGVVQLPPNGLLCRRHEGIHQRGDAIGRHPLQLGRCKCRLFIQRRRRNLLIHKDRGAVGEVAGRRAVAVAGDLASLYVRRFGGHPEQMQGRGC